MAPPPVAITPDDNFRFLFRDLQNSPDNLLPEDPATVASLKNLADSMTDSSTSGDSDTPSAYTYLGQFIDHDLTFNSTGTRLEDNTQPLAISTIEAIPNGRTSFLELDSVYQGAPVHHETANKLAVGLATDIGLVVTGKAPNNDLPRTTRVVRNSPADKLSPEQARFDRAAIIGDPRNDENTIVAQLHTAFLRAHNAIVDQGNDYAQARELLIKHYQWMVVHDFLARLTDDDVRNDILSGAIDLFAGRGDFIPVEFAMASYRFGHSMVRAQYEFNEFFSTGGNFGPAEFNQLFVFTALSGNSFNVPTLPSNWVIEWSRLLRNKASVQVTVNTARQIDTLMVEPLFKLTNSEGEEIGDPIMVHLARRNLIRGYQFRVPTGQAVAQKLGFATIDVVAASTPAQQAVLQASGFDTRTPLFFYTLAEAKSQNNGEKLGKVGSAIVASTIIQSIRNAPISMFDAANPFTPTLGRTPGQFDLTDLITLSGNLPDNVS